MNNVLYMIDQTPACDGSPASERGLPMWAEMAATRQGKKLGDELSAELGIPAVVVVRTHWHQDGSVCAHIAGKAYKITRQRVTLRGGK